MTNLHTFLVARESDSAESGIYIYQTQNGISVKDTTEAGERIFINEGIDSNTPIENHVKVALKLGDFIRFDSSEILRLETITFRVCQINLMPECSEDMEDRCKAIGAKFVNKLDHRCTHLVMKGIELQADFLLALIYEVQIVTPNYWITFMNRVQNQRTLPDPNNFRPIMIDINSHLNIDPNLLDVNSSRVNIFRGITFVFATKARMDNFEHIINSCKGKCINMEENYIPKTLLKYYTLIAEEMSQEYAEALKFHGRRLVPEIEITMAIIHASTNQFCNDECSNEVMLPAPMSAPSNQLQSEVISLSPKTSSTSIDAATLDTNEKKVKCTHCNKSYGHYSNMVRHRSKEHSSNENQKKYECYICSQSGSTYYNLQVHFARFHYPKFRMGKNLLKTRIIKKKRQKPQKNIIPNKPKSYEKIAQNIWVAAEPKKKSSPATCNCHPECCDNRCPNVISNIECSSINCKSSNCENRKFSYLVEDRTVVRYVSKDIGFGLFASQNIDQGDLIIRYLGEVIDKSEFRKRHNRDEKLLYFMVLGSHVIDATNYGNDSRFINNSCRPNANFIKWEVDGSEQIGIFANRDILKASSMFTNNNFNHFSIFLIRIFCRTRK